MPWKSVQAENFKPPASAHCIICQRLILVSEAMRVQDLCPPIQSHPDHDSNLIDTDTETVVYDTPLSPLLSLVGGRYCRLSAAVLLSSISRDWPLVLFPNCLVVPEDSAASCVCQR